MLSYLQAMEFDGVNERVITAMVAMIDALKAGVDALPGGPKGVQGMDMWDANFTAVPD